MGFEVSATVSLLVAYVRFYYILCPTDWSFHKNGNIFWIRHRTFNILQTRVGKCFTIKIRIDVMIFRFRQIIRTPIFKCLDPFTDCFKHTLQALQILSGILGLRIHILNLSRSLLDYWNRFKDNVTILFTNFV